MKVKNPFVITGYVGGEFFCDREQETADLVNYIENGHNIVLMSPRRMGKTGLINHVFEQDTIIADYTTFIIDIYSTTNFNEMVQEMGKSIITTLERKSEKALRAFLSVVSSLRAIMTFDIMGNPTWGIEKSSLQAPEYTLEQIFAYLENAEKPCVVAIDEFQQITRYPEKNVEAMLRTKIQRCRNTHFIYSGSERSLLGEMFASPSRPFYMSTSNMSLKPIDIDRYAKFITNHFHAADKGIDKDVITMTYDTFEGITWYIQKIMNKLYDMTDSGQLCSSVMLKEAVQRIVNENSMAYADLLYQLSTRQKELLIAIATERKATEIKGQTFIKKYNLPAPSTIFTTIKSLMDKQLVTCTMGEYEIYDKFLAIWIQQNY